MNYIQMYYRRPDTPCGKSLTSSLRRVRVYSFDLTTMKALIWEKPYSEPYVGALGGWNKVEIQRLYPIDYVEKESKVC